MKIVILDGHTLNPGDLSWAPLEKFGNVKVYERTEPDKIVERIGDAEIVLTNKTPITGATIAQCGKIKYIGVLATGYNVVDVAKANEAGIVVTNIPTYGTDAVSQFVFALLLEICHHVGFHSQTVFDGEWAGSKDWCYWHHPLMELAGKTMGIIGFGRIGYRTAQIAVAFGMKVLAFDAKPNPAFENESIKYASLERLYAEADVISLHCPLLDGTKGMINKASIDSMKSGAILINTSRGPLVNETDLAEALNSGKLRAAGVDVVSSEPILADNPLLKAKNLIITPHIAWAPHESRARLMDLAVGNVGNFLAGKGQNIVKG